MEYKNILLDFFPEEKFLLSGKKRLIVFLGCFADFDSFEFCQQIVSHSRMLANQSIDFILIGIGSEKSKEQFCRFNKIDIQKVLAVSNADIHEKLNFNKGLVSPLPAIINLLIMCAGINSNGTIKEVLRGYLGDKNAKSLFRPDEKIKIGSLSFFNGRMFDIFSNKDILRPLELATRRLMNMIEILSNWKIYVPDPSFLTQRGGTILLDENDEVLYKFISNNLLGYSNEMSSPLSFIDDFLN